MMFTCFICLFLTYLSKKKLLKLENLIRNKPVKYHSYNNFKNNYDVSLVFDDDYNNNVSNYNSTFS